MFFIGKKNKNIGYNVLSKVYFANIIVALAVAAIFACWISWKFQDVKDEISTQNSYFKNVLSNRASVVKFELDSIEKHLSDDHSDIDEVLSHHLSDPDIYLNFYLLDSKGKILNVADDKIGDDFTDFFASLPWKNKNYFSNGLYVSWFDLKDPENPTRFAMKELESGGILVAQVTLKFLKGDLERVNKSGNVENFIVGLNGDILFRADLESKTGAKNILDMYSLKRNFLQDSRFKMSNLSDENFDIYSIGCVESSRICAVSRYPVKNWLISNGPQLILGSILTLASILMIFVNASFIKNQILNPMETIRRMVIKLQRGEEISQHLGSYYISEISEIKDGLLKIYEESRKQKALYLDYERKFGFLFEKGPLMIILIDAKTGKIIDVSQKAIEFYGFDKDEILDKSVYDFTAARQDDIGGFSYELNSDEAIYEISQRLASGEIKDVRVSVKNIETSSGDKYGFCIVTDVTEEQLMMQNAQILNKADTYSPVLSLSWSGGLFENLKSVSANTERILGYTDKEILSKNFDFKKLVNTEDLERLIGEFNLKYRAFTTNKKQQLETLSPCRLSRKDGETIACSLCVKFISNGRSEIETIGYFLNSNMACENNMMCKAVLTKKAAAQTAY